MAAPLSVVIPTLNAGRDLAATLAALRGANETGLIREVVVSDGGSTDATASVADAAGCTVVTGAPGRGAQLSRGAAKARGAWLLFLHADSVLSEGWEAAASAHITMPERAAVFRLAFGSGGARSRLVAAGANVRTRMFGLPYGDQGLLIARGMYEALGGYDPSLPLFEDVDLVRRLLARRGRRALRMLPAYVRTSPDRYERSGYARRVAANQLLLARYLRGVPPGHLAARYR